MLTQPLLDKLSQLKLSGFRRALAEQLQQPDYADLAFEERLGLLLDVEVTRRQNNRLQRRIRQAKFPLQATLEDLNLSAKRGLKRAEVLHLAHSEWVGRQLNLLVLGPTGVGKTYLASALGRAACQANYTVRYLRTSRLLPDLDWLRPMVLIPSCWPSWPAPSCSSSMTGSGTPFPAPRPDTCSKSSMTAMAIAPPWSSPRCPWPTGTSASRTLLWLMPSRTG